MRLDLYPQSALIPTSIPNKLATAPSISFFSFGILSEKADDSGIPLLKAAGFALLLAAQLANQNSLSGSYLIDMYIEFLS